MNKQLCKNLQNINRNVWFKYLSATEDSSLSAETFCEIVIKIYRCKLIKV